MARIGRGILDIFSGTLGTVVGSSWKGIEYMRSKSRKKRKSFTEEQLEQQKRFSFGVKFMNIMRDLFQTTFKGHEDEMTQVNNALSHLLKNAMTGTSPNLRIDYSQLYVAKGSIPQPKNGAATAPTPGEISFTWTDNSNIGKAKETDIAVLVVFCDELQEVEYAIGTATRNGGSATLAVPQFAGKIVHTWLAFLSDKKKEASPSVFTGEHTVG
jgi:hypothetical protein